MKKLITLLSVLPMLSLAQSVEFSHNWEESLLRAKEEKKPMLIDFYTDWCGWCKVQDSATWGDPVVAAFVNENLIPVKLNAEKDGGSVAVRFKPTGYPSVFVFDPNSESPRIIRYVGYNEDNEEYLNQLKKDLNDGWTTLGYDPSGESPEFPKFILDIYGPARPEFPKAEELTQWFEEHGSYTDEVAWTVLLRSVYWMDSELLDKLLTHADHFRKVYGEGPVMDLYEGVIYTKVRSAETEEELNQVLAWIDAELGDDAPETDQYKMTWYENHKQWSEYLNTLQAVIEKLERVNPAYVNLYVWKLVSGECEDQSVCARAAELLAPYVNGEDADPNYVDTYAWILYRAGKSEDARAQAERAIELNGSSIDSSQELIDLIESEE